MRRSRPGQGTPHHHPLPVRPGGVAGRHRVRLDRYGQLAGALLGFAIAMTVNLATDDFGSPGTVAALMATAVLASRTARGGRGDVRE
ncbi:MAG TPA: hypothetical protein VF755_23625 [Catenuloplanes sp.]